MNQTPLLALSLLASLLFAPGTAALGVLNDPNAASDQLRLTLDEGPLEARALEGAPSVNGDPVGASMETLDSVPIEPWNGYPRTVLVTLAGPGELLLVDNASGVVIKLDDAGPSGSGSPNGDKADASSDAASDPSTPDDGEPGTSPPPGVDDEGPLGPTDWGQPGPDAGSGQAENAGLQTPGDPGGQQAGQGWLWVALVASLAGGLLVASRGQIEALARASLEHLRGAAIDPDLEEPVRRSVHEGEDLRGTKPPRRAPSSGVEVDPPRVR